jgi:hypothetical protein
MTFSQSKLGKHKVMSGSSFVRQALPSTRSLNETNFRTFLARYRQTIVKPVGKYGGAGVMKVTALDDGRCAVHYGSRTKVLEDMGAAYDFIRRKAGKSRYLVQRYIPLARIGGRPFDLRVMVQRGGGTRWRVTGKLAKVAGPGYIITNIRRAKGYVLPARTAVARSDAAGSASHILREVDRVSLAAVRRLHRVYRWIRTVGMDIGVDTQGKVWIIEGNFQPDLTLFRKLKDKSQYRRITAMHKRRRR